MTIEKECRPRRESYQLRVVCSPSERAVIEANAKAAGLSVSTFLRTVGMGYRVTGIVDYEAVRDMVRVNGDLGRLGGLLKLWLTDDARMKPFGREYIDALLAKIESVAVDLSALIATVLTQRGGSNGHKRLAAKRKEKRSAKDD